MYTVGSLFTGIGGIDLAFMRAGFEIKFQVEIDPFCMNLLNIRFPDTEKHTDVKNVGKRNLPIIDVLCGGFPCQDISAAGKGAGIQVGNRSGLWYEYARIISEIRPRYIFIENVPAITTRGGTIVIAQLASMGYDAEWGIIPASAVGAPHIRNRWYCVGRYSSSVRRYYGINHRIKQLILHDGKRGYTESKSKRDQRGDRVRAGSKTMGNPYYFRLKRNRAVFESIAYPRSEKGAFTSASVRGNGQEYDDQPGMGRIFNGLSFGMDGSHQWPNGMGHTQYEWEPPRTVNRKDVPNLSNRIKALGNAVVPQVIYPFARRIKECLDKDINNNV